MIVIANLPMSAVAYSERVERERERKLSNSKTLFYKRESISVSMCVGGGGGGGRSVNTTCDIIGVISVSRCAGHM